MNTGILISESGVILDDLNKYVQDLGYIVPYDLGAKSSCYIGGNIATNAGGIHLIRWIIKRYSIRY